jgi:hypothetical protein
LGLSPSFVVLLFAVSASALPQATDPKTSGMPQSFHDEALDITYFYPSQFTPIPDPPSTENAKCGSTKLLAHANNRIGNSSFTVSTVDNACPETPRDAAALLPFVRGQILNQLKPFGMPAITREPMRYLLDGRPAAITLASVAAPGKGPHPFYAGKACAMSGVPAKHHKKSDPPDPGSHVLCFDFTTDNADLVSNMLSFIVQFGNDPPEPLFLANAQPRP